MFSIKAELARTVKLVLNLIWILPDQCLDGVRGRESIMTLPSKFFE